MKSSRNIPNPTVAQWIRSNRLYEDNLFYYALIILVWFFIGFSFLGFEIDSYSQTQNLFFNFLFYLFICVMMALCPFWYKLLFSKTTTQKRAVYIQQRIEQIKDFAEKQAILEYMTKNGQLPMRPAQKWALVFLGSYFLFEVFFISAWVKDLALVWEPRWASMLIEWVRANTDFVSDEGVNHQLFSVYLSGRTPELNQLFTSEREFVFSGFGGATALFQVFRSFCFPLLLGAFATIIWRPLDWLGGLSVDPRNIHSVGSFIFSSVATLAMTLLFFGLFFYAKSLSSGAVLLFDKQHWLDGFSWNFAFVFAILAIKFIYGWFLFLKNLFLH